MSIPNDTLRLRFFRDEEPVFVEADVLYTILDGIMGIVEAVVGTTRSDTVNHTISFVGPPRRGSLEFLLVPHFDVNLNVEGLRYCVGPDAKEAAEKVRDWCMFFYTVTFGGTGLLALVTHKAKASLVPLEEAVKADRVAEHPNVLQVGVAYTALGRAPVKRAIFQLLSEAANAGYNRVEIELRDERPIALHDIEEDTSDWSIRPEKTGEAAPSPRASRRRVRRS